MKTLEDKLAHSRSAYRYALRGLPDINDDSQLPVQKNGFTFERVSQLQSMVIELGWAFFSRYEGCLEAYIKSHGIQLSKTCQLKDWLSQKRYDIPPHFRKGIDDYRSLRNKLHHEDGASLEGREDEEIHILPEHMENFYGLFVWCGKCIEKWANHANSADAKSRPAD
jgi:hypothetical protein